MDENSIKRIQPHNKKAEQSVLGAMMMDNEVISQVEPILAKEDFYITQYGIIYETILELYNENVEADVITIPERLKSKNIGDEKTNSDVMAELALAVPTIVKAKDYAQIVRKNSTLRKLIKLCENTTTDCYAGGNSVDFILENIEQKIFKLVQGYMGGTKEESMKEVVLNIIKKMEADAHNKGEFTGIPTGFTDLDRMLTGMHGGELIIVAARPAMGKTAFVLNIVHHLAVKKNVPCLIYSLEMSKEQLGTRLMAIDAMVDSKAMKLSHTLTDDDWDKIMETMDVMSDAPIYMVDNSAISIAELRSQARMHKQNHNIGLIVIDYLQLMSPSGRVESRQNFIADVSRSLKNLARELDVPIIALSQLSRGVESRNDKMPVMSDIRESGAIEQDADVIMFIHRDEYYNPDTTEKPNTAEINIAKNRSGETGTIDLRWIGKYTKFANPEKYYNPPDGK
ncbi:MAG: replicative DNA helicase [Lachnospiraceae bacterium]|nr:replicative DNA helicase [Lachnospiraceae bacterium]